MKGNWRVLSLSAIPPFRPWAHHSLYKQCLLQHQKTIGNLQRTTLHRVDKQKSLSEKVDAPWNEITGLGGDRHNAQRSLFCEDGVYSADGKIFLLRFSTESCKYL
jgi:hypothetical protein